MTYMHRGGPNSTQLTISTWLKINQSALDDAFNQALLRKIPILTLGTSKDKADSGSTGHVTGSFGAQIGGRLAGGNTEQIFAVGSQTGTPPAGAAPGSIFTGVPYYVTSGTWDADSHPSVNLSPNPSGFSGTTIARDATTDEVLGTLDWDFSGILMEGHSASSINWVGFHGDLIYGYDKHFTSDTIVLSPSALFIDYSDNTVNFQAFEYAVQRLSPIQFFTTFYEFSNALVTDTSWNHVFCTLDLTEPSAVKHAMVVNNADSSIHTMDLSSFTLPAIGGEQLGIPITPQEITNHFTVGANPRIRQAYTQVWFNQYIEPTADNLAKFFKRKDGKLIPPTDIQAAQKAFGPSDIWCYRDKRKNIQYQINKGTGGSFTVVGTSPKDYTPGPGQ